MARNELIPQDYCWMIIDFIDKTLLRFWNPIGTVDEVVEYCIKKSKNLDDGDEIVGMQLDHQGDSLLIVSENGLGKRTYLEEFKIQYRGGKGVKCYKVTDKTGYVVGVKAVTDEHEIMMITTEGIIIQLRMDDISTLGRITSGVKMINLDSKVKVAKIAKVREKVSDGNQELSDEEVMESEKENSDEDVASNETLDE